MIVCVGDLLLDIFILPDLRAEEQGTGVLVRPGGSAANTAAWSAFGGTAVAMVGCIGPDIVGDMLMADLEGRHVQTRLRAVARLETGAVVVRLGDDGERVMRSARGANMDLSPSDVLAARTLEPDWLHLTGYALLCDHGLDILRAAGDVCRAAGARLSFDPSSLGVIGRFGAEALMRAVREAGCALLLPNREEATALSGEKDAAVATARLGVLVPQVIVKDGPRGAIYSEHDVRVDVPTVPLRAIDSTGAGDAFDAGVLCALEDGRTIEDSCIEGHRLGKLAVQAYGGRPPAPRD